MSSVGAQGVQATDQPNPRTKVEAMKIFGVSQSSGVERLLQIERGLEGIVLTLSDHVGGKELARIFVPTHALVGAIMDPVAGGSLVEGVPQPQGPAMRLEIEVRRNEVLFQIRGDKTPGADVAVGLDDLQDALEGVTSREG